MKGLSISFCIFVFASVLSFGQTAAVRLEVMVPSDTSANIPNVYVTGSFNFWNHDSSYLMKRTGNNLYSLVIPVFDGKKYEYKYTQGNWNSVEVSTDGSEIKNRMLVSQDGLVKKDTVLKWKSDNNNSTKKDSALVLNSKQVEELTKMKAEMETKIAEKTKSAGDLLKKASENMLSEKPDPELRKKFHDEIIGIVSFALELASDAMWKTASVLTPEQKKAILQELNKPNAPNDIFGLISNALVVPKK